MKEKKNKDKKRGLTMRDLILPIGSLMVAVLIIIFVLIPAIAEIHRNTSEIEEIREKQALLTTHADYLDKIDIEELREASRIMLKSIPEDREVADVASYVDSVARNYNVRIEQISASNTFEEGNQIVRISVPIAFSGSYENISGFLKEIQVESPYAVEIGSLAMDKAKYDQWNGKITVVMFQMQQKSSNRISAEQKRDRIYLPVNSFDSARKIVQIIKDRVAD